MTDKERGAVVIWCTAFTLFGMMVGGCCGAFGEMKDIDAIRADAARNNAGRWVVDPKTGKTAWEWTGRE